MAAVGTVRESQGSENSVETESLARFAVEEYNKKEVGEAKKISLKFKCKNNEGLKDSFHGKTIYWAPPDAPNRNKKKFLSNLITISLMIKGAFVFPLFLDPFCEVKHGCSFAIVEDLCCNKDRIGKVSFEHCPKGFKVNIGACQNECSELRCGDIPIKFPFRLKDKQPDHCGYPGFDLSCNGSNNTVLELPISVKFIVTDINYKSQVIQVVDPDGCVPRQLHKLNPSASAFQFKGDYQSDYTLFNCSPADRDLYYQIPCLSGTSHQMLAIDSDSSIDAFPISSCTKLYNLPPVSHDIFKAEHVLRLEWFKPECKHCERKGRKCKLKNNNHTESETECFNEGKQGVILGSFLFLVALVSLHRLYTSDRKQTMIEEFLENYRALKPTRYSYADIKRITNTFRDKLGQGTFGTVYKGKLSNEIFVAVKILNNSKGNGEEFINEVGTLGRIHYVNVVRLVGYCADGFRRALVYEFAPNGSLQNFITSADSNNHFLGWEKLQYIALSVAKGIEYLHNGCDQRILHFDIKPHNVLLDENFNPKISDFGLSKLCANDQSAVSLTTARGTMGYIAPEVFSRNFGNVSYKSDVYSFGMLLLEMVGGRKNVQVTEANSSQVYFPEWIYNLLDQGEDIRIHVEQEIDAKIAKKLAIVGLWCIQWYPVDRPSMKAVVQMLEGEDNVKMPPNPFSSTASTRDNVTMPAKRPRQELPVISELD
ncbi:PREDICTED: rust resistance kinase Lr10 [Prunus dulcis]|uniref:PREDICTED: rust resistance kinase Lr10 n=1 Tax=Prunus dulcis TaxID=3755 RepID=A0A5E4GA22_PRUDU|nr:PREDICTED: rust resistance kinase Lr10 [Prunus dulcis]